MEPMGLSRLLVSTVGDVPRTTKSSWTGVKLESKARDALSVPLGEAHVLGNHYNSSENPSSRKCR